jgi:hypothetical protein
MLGFQTWAFKISYLHNELILNRFKSIVCKGKLSEFKTEMRIGELGETVLYSPHGVATTT